ncbi:GPI-anchor transamidase precursor, putative [Perkinsus marinus ATCC 50983]|uniref:GPI-anchor transamidase, putative n=1 Tax=Perkinsus marinus (strain ATCC 50983 / TXsc) TaxID=423536 RepID=C5KDB0_PERM5|nr:GPI-anchor transamidase precursor, putative [Perkinsus marinus ATCC 50983]EER17543.1 GPI-anchor transamidase precursor, putative [Perkinsus marinus ATCC 50983]|eukprot:XP_002785747.1 GPI-anchor transamidase precursor, putative [Perkinsus marinus ATCC 50983]
MDAMIAAGLLMWLLCVVRDGAAMESDSGRNNWAILVDTSRYWYNYRHVANTLSMYYQIKRLGIPDSNIILMLAEDVACNPRNPAPGYVFNDPDNHLNLYPPEVEVDYRGDEVSTENFIRLLTGRHTADTPKSKRLDTDADSYVLVYITGHSGTDFVKFQDWEEMTSHDIADAFQQMFSQRRYKKLLWLADTCHAATLHDRFYSPNMLCLSSSGPDENSYSYHADLSLGVNVVDRFTYWTSRFLSDSVKDTRSQRTVQDLVDALPWSKLHSHATLREDLYPSSASETLLTEFLAATDQFVFVDEFQNLTKKEGEKKVSHEVSRAAEVEQQGAGDDGQRYVYSGWVVDLPGSMRALLSALVVLWGAASSAVLPCGFEPSVRGLL